MHLEPEQQAVLNGESGQAMAMVMKTLVLYGKALGAKRLIPVKSAHLAGSFGAFTYHAYYRIIDQLVAEGIKFKVPTTVNPRPGHNLKLLNRLYFSKQKYLDTQLSALGVIPSYSCVCYEKANVPEFGDRLAWAESSAVQFANSVVGARTNRNSVLMELFSAITGLTPEFGFLLDENRLGNVMIKLDIKNMDSCALGFIIGKKVVDQVPVIEHYSFTHKELKCMGAAMAASGGIALYHVEGLTPEAPDLQSVFDSQPETTITITQADIDGIRTKHLENVNVVAFGCPQMTLEDVKELAHHFIGKRVKVPTWFNMIPADKENLSQTDLYDKLHDSGVEIYDHCPTAALEVQIRRKKVLTNSGKMYYYLQGSEYAKLEDCLRVCGVEG